MKYSEIYLVLLPFLLEFVSGHVIRPSINPEQNEVEQDSRFNKVREDSWVIDLGRRHGYDLKSDKSREKRHSPQGYYYGRPCGQQQPAPPCNCRGGPYPGYGGSSSANAQASANAQLGVGSNGPWGAAIGAQAGAAAQASSSGNGQSSANANASASTALKIRTS